MTIHNEEIMINKVAPPTDPATMETVDLLLELLPVEVPNKNLSQLQ